MTRQRYIDISIQLDIDANPIAGRLRHGAGATRPFYGWLGLASELEHALTAGRLAPAGDTAAAADDRGGETTRWEDP